MNNSIMQHLRELIVLAWSCILGQNAQLILQLQSELE